LKVEVGDGVWWWILGLEDGGKNCGIVYSVNQDENDAYVTTRSGTFGVGTNIENLYKLPKDTCIICKYRFKCFTGSEES
jgi:hypothetical protein